MNENVSTYEKMGPVILHQLVDTFYDQVMNDERINHLFKTDLETVKDKQFRFLTQFFGGPGLYVEKYGPPRMRLKHMPHKITSDAAKAWLENMAKALETLEIDEALKDEIFSRFPKVAAHMVNS